jgi:hypothetical protein
MAHTPWEHTRCRKCGTAGHRESWTGRWPSGGDPGFEESNPAPYDCEDCTAEQSAKEVYRTKKLELLERLVREVSLMRGAPR